MERYLELDSEFRRRWRLYHTDGGKVYDSREINWRRVPWARIVKIEVFLRDEHHVFTNEHPGFKFFLNFKGAAVINKPLEDGGYDTEHRRSWINGWSDGKYAYLTEFDFVMGNVLSEETRLLEEVAAHIHPDVQAGLSVKGMRTKEELGY